MNIFILNSDPALAARDMCDKHVVKMILETAQLLCSAHIAGHAPYRPTHLKHPCTIWTAASYENYMWLVKHGLALLEEYRQRYGKDTHGSAEALWWCGTHVPLSVASKKIGLTPFAQAMPVEYKDENAVVAYRRYYLAEKSRFAKWKNGIVPIWYSEKNPMHGLEIAV